MRKFISYNQSMKLLQELDIKSCGTKKVFISNSLGQVLAQDIIASDNSPAFRTSAMDGYAIKYEDQKNKKIKIIDKNPAGSIVHSEVSNGVCIKTFTGSLMPNGSDTLIPIENVIVQDDYIIINQEVVKNFSVREVGENYKKGEVLIKKGTLIDFAHIGVMASLNIVQVEVFQKPKIAIASTGSEILDVGELQTNDAQIRSSNHLTLEAIATKYGATCNQMGVVKDDKESIKNLLIDTLEHNDIVVTTGGVSVGDYDFVKDIIKEHLGCDVVFQGVHIKPGQHLLVAQKENKIIIGLPGFAYSSTVTFLLYVLPLLFRYKGSNEKLNIIEATLSEDFVKKGDKTTFVACNVVNNNGAFSINFDGKKTGTSAILTNMLGNTGLLILQENENNLKANDKVKVMFPL